MAEMLFYRRIEALSRQMHATLRFNPPKDYSFARTAVAVPLVAIEFPMACRHYPIVFSSDPKGDTIALALLALTGTENLFVDGKGRWTCAYVPAFVRRYPFVLADITEKPGQAVLAVDMDSGCFNDKEGQALFDADEHPSTFVEKQLAWLEQFRQEAARTRRFIATLKEEALLRPMEINVVRAGDKARFNVKNAVTVDEVKLNKLPPDKAAAYLSSGLLGTVHAHLISLQNFGAVANRTGNPSEDIVPWWAR